MITLSEGVVNLASANEDLANPVSQDVIANAINSWREVSMIEERRRTNILVADGESNDRFRKAQLALKMRELARKEVMGRLAREERAREMDYEFAVELSRFKDQLPKDKLDKVLQQLQNSPEKRQVSDEEMERLIQERFDRIAIQIDTVVNSWCLNRSRR